MWPSNWKPWPIRHPDICYQQIAVEIPNICHLHRTHIWQIVQSLIMQIFVISDFDLSTNDQLGKHTIFQMKYDAAMAECMHECVCLICPGWLKRDNQIIFLSMVKLWERTTIAFRKSTEAQCMFLLYYQWLMKHSCLISDFNIRVINVCVGREQELGD